MKELLYGAAYYDEYMPYDRLDKDVEMMKKAGINTVRIAESTWSTCEPQPGVFDFSHVERVMDAMEEAGINVIIGTPTYAVPTWMVKAHPDVLAETVRGKRHLRRPSDHGHYPSGVPFLCGACNPRTDEASQHIESASSVSSWIMRRNITELLEKTCRSSL